MMSHSASGKYLLNILMVSGDVIVLLYFKIIQVDNEDLELARKNLIKISVHNECTHTLKKKSIRNFLIPKHFQT